MIILVWLEWNSCSFFFHWINVYNTTNYLTGTNPPVGGDLVLTSGLGGYYPSGLVIGTVEDVRTDDSGLTQYAVVQPRVTPADLVEVFIITSFDVVD